MTTHNRQAAPLISLLLSMLCSVACGDPEQNVVPYQQGGESSEGSTNETDGAEEQWTPAVGTTLAPGTRRVQLGNVEFSPEGQEIRVALRVDTDQDGADDVLAITRRSDGSTSLVFARKRGESLSALQTLHQQEANPACTVTNPRLETLSPTLAIASLSWACPEQTETPPPLQSVWMLRLGVHPRLGERVAIHQQPGSESRARLEIQRISPEDPDWDPELITLLVTLQQGAVTARQVLQWRDHPSGFALDRESLQSALMQTANQALTSEANSDRKSAAFLIRSICRGFAPELSIGGVSGLPCRARPVYRSLVIRQIQEALSEGNWSQALSLERDELENSQQLTPSQATSLEQAWASRAEQDYEWRSLPDAPQMRSGDSIGPGRIVFLAENEIALRSPGAPPDQLAFRITLRPTDTSSSSGSQSEAIEAPRAFTDPSGTSWELQGVHRTCSGYRMIVAPRGVPRVTSLPGDLSRSPLVQLDPGPKRDACIQNSLSLLSINGGWRTLGWIPGSIYLGGEDGALRLPVDESGRSVGSPTPITGRLPEELVALRGGVRNDGFAFALPTPHGVLIQQLDHTQQAHLLRPPDMSGSHVFSDTAFAPSGRRIAMSIDGRLWLAEAANAPALPTAPPAPAPSTLDEESPEVETSEPGSAEPEEPTAGTLENPANLMPSAAPGT